MRRKKNGAGEVALGSRALCLPDEPGLVCNTLIMACSQPSVTTVLESDRLFPGFRGDRHAPPIYTNNSPTHEIKKEKTTATDTCHATKILRRGGGSSRPVRVTPLGSAAVRTGQKG